MMKTCRSSHPMAADLDFILRNTPNVWNEFRGKQIFVTGGTGFLGTCLLESFCWANAHLSLGAKAVVLSRDPNGFRSRFPLLALDPAVSFIQGDIRHFSFPAGKFSHIIHGATDSSIPSTYSIFSDQIETIVVGAKRTLEFAAQSGTTKILFISSGAVYGPQASVAKKIPESFPGTPIPFSTSAGYGLGKKMAEYLCQAFVSEHAIEVKIARCFAFLGPRLPGNSRFAIGNFIRDALAGGPIIVKGNGSAVRSYLYTADLAVWLWTILSKGKSLDPYNVGSDRGMSIAQIARRVGQHFSPHCTVEFAGPSSNRKEGRYIPSIKKAKRDLGLSVKTPLSTALKKTIDWEIKSSNRE